MLGWEFFITRQGEERPWLKGREDSSFARWKAGLGGDNWIRNLVEIGIATDLGGSGYPNSYLVSASAICKILGGGLPKHDGPLVIGDDYVMPGGWRGDGFVDIDRLRALDPGEMLLVEAWDQS